MKTLKQYIVETLAKSTEGDLVTIDGEKLTYRVDNTGHVKIEGQNMRKDFSSIQEAEKFLKLHQISKI